MRVQVYNEEFTDEIVVIEKTAADTGVTFYGVRLFLKSPDDLHSTPEDDDRSAVTFWCDSESNANFAAAHFRIAMSVLQGEE